MGWCLCAYFCACSLYIIRFVYSSASTQPFQASSKLFTWGREGLPQRQSSPSGYDLVCLNGGSFSCTRRCSFCFEGGELSAAVDMWAFAWKASLVLVALSPPITVICSAKTITWAAVPCPIPTAHAPHPSFWSMGYVFKNRILPSNNFPVD